MPKFQVMVTVDCETLEQAQQVAAERLSHDEDYGFEYRLDYGTVEEASPQPLWTVLGRIRTAEHLPIVDFQIDVEEGSYTLWGADTRDMGKAQPIAEALRDGLLSEDLVYTRVSGKLDDEERDDD